MPRLRRVPVDDSGKDPNQDQDHSPPEPQTCDCPFLDGADWHEIESDWSDIAFVQIKVPAVMGVPLKFREVKKRLRVQAESIGATVPEDPMVLLGEGKMRRPVMLEVEPEDDADPKKIVTPGGIAFTRLVPAPWGEIKKEHQATVRAAVERYGRKPDVMWLWYLTCSICSGDRDFETLFVAYYEHAPESEA
jgi:hypothetical protein